MKKLFFGLLVAVIFIAVAFSPVKAGGDKLCGEKAQGYANQHTGYCHIVLP